MNINKIQLAIFTKMAKEKSVEIDEFIEKFSNHYLGKTVRGVDQLLEEEADTWINKAYLESLEK
jgi:hypothetical protein